MMHIVKWILMKLIQYYINDHNKIKLFGHDFAEKNKNNNKIIINGKEDELKEYKAYHFHF